MESPRHPQWWQRRSTRRGLALGFFAAVVIIVTVAVSVFDLSKFLKFPEASSDSQGEDQLRILAYSSFTSSWGPGPSLVKLFEEKMKAQGRKVDVILLQAEDSGLLLAKMDSFPTDLVIGFDQLGLHLAARAKAWRPHGVSGAKYSNELFLAFDWSPIGLVYRKGEIEPPKNFEDLLDSRFEGAIALQDPRSSSVGFQFLNWLVREKGETAAFQYLQNLKPNVHSMSGAWSQSYGMFTRGLAKLTVSYATSILYHRLSEKDDRYAFAIFPGAHPVQTEYAAIPETCRNCDLAQEFMKFMSEPEAQAVIMNRNWMMPVNLLAARGSPFETFMIEIEQTGGLRVQDPGKLPTRDPAKLLEKWRKVGL